MYAGVDGGVCGVAEGKFLLRRSFGREEQECVRGNSGGMCTAALAGILNRAGRAPPVFGICILSDSSLAYGQACCL